MYGEGVKAMARRLSAIAGVFSVALVLGAMPSPVHAQPAPWQADKGFENGIPIGTKITQANWQQYQQFMPESMIHLFKGDLFWHMPKDLEIDVGPTRHILPPKPYREHTEKYGSQTTLMKTADGGYLPRGYVAGFPFANPFAGDKDQVGAKMYYNDYYRPAPRVEEAPNCSYTLDQYANFTRTADSIIVFSQLTHLSEPGYPQDVPGNNGYFFAEYFEQTAPEQGKYFASLLLTSNDPTTLDELYEYIPSLRRSLRLSQAARCSPIFGTDFVYEDAQEGAPRMGNLFNNVYVGEKKVLTLMHGAPESFNTCGTPTSLDPRYYYFGLKGVVPFPNPGSGQWEVRDTYMVEMTRLPAVSRGYCYGKRLMYFDKENYFPDHTEVWDRAGNLYKWIVVFAYPAILPNLGLDGQEVTITGPNTGYVVNFQDQHATVFIGLHVCVDKECDAQGFSDISRYASPEGLMKIMQ
jgi:hypothetical protein